MTGLRKARLRAKTKGATTNPVAHFLHMYARPGKPRAGVLLGAVLPRPIHTKNLMYGSPIGLPIGPDDPLHGLWADLVTPLFSEP